MNLKVEKGRRVWSSDKEYGYGDSWNQRSGFITNILSFSDAVFSSYIYVCIIIIICIS